ncbi:hypothetical protein CSX04_04589 [Burkholderia cepacia]|nr:hypothetical protein CSX04_04589 [Burkholderia cepacia]
MHAWQVKPGDGVAGLRRIDATRRAVGPTDVVVKIHSAGLNYRDLMFARGDYLGIGNEALIPVATAPAKSSKRAATSRASSPAIA